MKFSNKRLVLIDGHAILHRAYHALPPTFTNKEGTSTNAVYGFTTMLLRILSDLKPDYLVVAFDLPQPTFRQQQYTAYQAKRPEMQGNLVDQIPLVHELLEALKIGYFEVAGFEADDVIGTLASQSQKSKVKSQKLETVIVTGDRDLLQLVDRNTKVCVPVKGLSETKIYDEATVRSEYRVQPCQWVDVKALKGDSSDNYPGVRGIGPKTAQELIAKFGTLESLFSKLDELVKFDPKLAQKLAEGAQDAGMGKKLATIVTDVPVHLDLEKAEVGRINWQSGVEYMRTKLGFKSIPEKIEKEYLALNQKSKVKNEKPEDTSKQLELI